AFLDARVWLDFNGSQRAEGANLERLLNALIARKPPAENSPSAIAETSERKVTDEFVARVRVAAVGNSRQIEKVLDEWSRTASTDAAPLIAAAEVLVGKAEFERALAVLEKAPEMLRVRQLRAFALRKQGHIDESIALFEALQREGNLDAETGGLLAGSYKARWLRTGDLGFRQRAYVLYSDAFERAGDPFNGINAAAMALYCGDEAKMYHYAEKVIETLRERPVDSLDYWDMATLGEGYLLKKRFDDARDWYARAVGKAAGLHQNIAVMRRQARQNLKALNRPPDQLDDVLPVPRVLAYIGHMVDTPGRAPPRFPASKVGAVRLAIRAQIAQHGALHGFGCAARGADLLFLEELARRGLTATIVLPFPEPDFCAVSVGGPWDSRFAKLRETPGIEFAKPLQDIRPAEDRLQSAFADANQEVLRRAIEYAGRLDEIPVVIAVWDGQPGDGPGGTAEAVELWRAEGYAVEVIDITKL
ncbi:MAG: tetratricopeptide repeat-containing protein, partial [Betaproteobacteria bacterium]